MKIYFKSRSAMRSHNSGKQYDHGSLAVKRWARDLQDQIKPDGVDKRLTTCNNGKGKQVTVITHNSKVKLVIC